MINYRGTMVTSTQTWSPKRAKQLFSLSWNSRLLLSYSPPPDPAARLGARKDDKCQGRPMRSSDVDASCGPSRGVTNSRGRLFQINKQARRQHLGKDGHGRGWRRTRVKQDQVGGTKDGQDKRNEMKRLTKLFSFISFNSECTVDLVIECAIY